MVCKQQENIERGCVERKKEPMPNTLMNVLRTGLLRLLGANRDREYPLGIGEETAQVVTTLGDSYSHYDAHSALLEAERLKAQALMEWEKHRLIC